MHEEYIKHHYIGCAVIFTSGSILVFSFPKKIQGQKNRKEYIVCASGVEGNNVKFKFVLVFLRRTLLIAKFINE